MRYGMGKLFKKWGGKMDVTNQLCAIPITKNYNMRRFLLATLIILLSFTAIVAQDSTVIIEQPTVTVPTKKVRQKPVFGDGLWFRDSTWHIGGFAGATISQVAFYQWGPGGTNSFAFLLTGNLYFNYKKDKIIWDNNLDLKWGMVANGLIRKSSLAQRNFQKNIDLIGFKSIFGYEVSKSLYASAKLGFESQFSPTYDYAQTDTAGGAYRRYTISKFAAPAILTIAPGLTWKPKDYLTVFFSPVGGKMTFVQKDSPGRDTTTLPDGSFTDAYYNDVDETRFGLTRGTGFMGELGGELDILFQKDIIKNVNWKSHLNVFVSYMNKNYNTDLPAYYSETDSVYMMPIAGTTKHIPVVKWDNDIVFKINKFLTATLSARFVYQYNAIVPIDERNNTTGTKGADGYTDVDKAGKLVTAYNKLQIFEQFGIALSYKF